MASGDEFVEELAQTVNRLFLDGTTNPRAKEIARVHYEPRSVPPELVEAVSKRLPRVRDKLRGSYEYNRVHLVSETYYDRFQEDLPRNEEQARLCLPLGYKKSAKGIRIPEGDDDPIWQATVVQNLGAGSSKAGKNIRRLAKAFREGNLSPEKFERALNEVRNRSGEAAAEAERLLEEALTRALPSGAAAGDDDEEED